MAVNATEFLLVPSFGRDKRLGGQAELIEDLQQQLAKIDTAQAVSLEPQSHSVIAKAHVSNTRAEKALLKMLNERLDGWSANATTRYELPQTF